MRSYFTKTTGLLAFLGCFIAAVEAAPLTWTFQNVVYTSGALTLEGSFDYDAATNTYSNLDLMSAGAVEVAPNNPLPSANETYLPVTVQTGNLDGAQLFQFYFEQPLTDAGGIVDLRLQAISSYGFCAESDCRAVFPVLFAISGRVVSSNVNIPIPAAAWLLMPALGVLVGTRRA